MLLFDFCLSLFTSLQILLSPGWFFFYSSWKCAVYQLMKKPDKAMTEVEWSAVAMLMLTSHGKSSGKLYWKTQVLFRNIMDLFIPPVHHYCISKNKPSLNHKRLITPFNGSITPTVQANSPIDSKQFWLAQKLFLFYSIVLQKSFNIKAGVTEQLE